MTLQEQQTSKKGVTWHVYREMKNMKEAVCSLIEVVKSIEDKMEMQAKDSSSQDETFRRLRGKTSREVMEATRTVFSAINFDFSQRVDDQANRKKIQNTADEVLSACNASNVKCDRRTALFAVKTHFRSKKKVDGGLSKKVTKRQRIYSRKDRKLQRRKRVLTMEEKEEYSDIMKIAYMSSDDDDTDSGEGEVTETLFRKSLPWRSGTLSNFFKNLDERYQKTMSKHNIKQKRVILKGVSNSSSPEDAPEWATQDVSISPRKDDIGKGAINISNGTGNGIEEDSDDDDFDNDLEDFDVDSQSTSSPHNEDTRHTRGGARVRGGCNSARGRAFSATSAINSKTRKRLSATDILLKLQST